MRHAVCSPEFALLAVSAFLSFLLISASAFVLYGVLARLATAAATRCTLAVAYIAGTTALWVRTLGVLCAAAAVPQLPAVPHAVAPDSLTVVLPARALPLLTSFVPASLAVYALCLLTLACAGLARRKRLNAALAFRVAPPAPLAGVFSTLASEAGVARSRLWLRPAVYLPAEASEPSGTLPGILRHELAHLRRGDQLWEGVARFGRALLFFHPGVHRAFSALRLQRELACDLQVVRTAPSDRSRYADTLVRFGWKVREAGVPDSFGLRFTGRASVLQTRVRSILDGEPTYSRASRRQRMLFGAAGLWLFAALAPALSIGTSLVRSSLASTAVPETPVFPPAPRPLRARAVTHGPRMLPRAEAAKPVTETAAAALPELPHTLPEVRYRGSSSALMPARRGSSREEAEQAGAPDDGPQVGSGSAPRGLKNPSTMTSVLIGAAVELGRIGLSHTHDKD